MAQRRSWTEEEDRALRYLKDSLHVKKWSQISRRLELEFNLPGRNGKQCRQRYTNHLDSSIICREFTSEDEEKLFQLHDRIGNKWSLISKQFKGRTDNHIKNHFHSKLRKGIRKLNKEIKQYYKKSLKQFKLNVIYKVVEASDFRFCDKMALNEEAVNSFNELKNFLLQYAGGMVSQTQLSDMSANEQALFLASKLEIFQKFIKNKKQAVKSDKSQNSESLLKIKSSIEQIDSTTNSENSSNFDKEIPIEEDDQSDCVQDDESLQFVIQGNNANLNSKFMEEETFAQAQYQGRQIMTSHWQAKKEPVEIFYSFSNDIKQINEPKQNQSNVNSHFTSIPQSLIEQREFTSVRLMKKLSINSIDSLREYDDNLNESQIHRMMKRFDSYSDIEAGLFE